MKITLPIKEHDFSKQIKDFKQFLENNGYLKIYQNIEAIAPGKIYILGGVIRDFYMSQINNTLFLINDLDLVIDDVTKPISEEEMQVIFSKLGELTKNRYNSYKLITFNGKEIDIIPFTQSKYSKEYNETPSIATRLKTAFFKLESVAVDMQKQILYEIGFFEDLNNKTLSVLNDQYGQYHSHYVRAILYGKKLNFKIDQTVIDFLKKKYIITSSDSSIETTEKLIKDYLVSKKKVDQTEYVFLKLKELEVINSQEALAYLSTYIPPNVERKKEL